MEGDSIAVPDEGFRELGGGARERVVAAVDGLVCLCRLESRDNGQGNAKECEGNGRREKGGGRKYTPVRALSFSERERESRHLRER